MKHKKFGCIQDLTEFYDRNKITVLAITAEGRFAGNTNIGTWWHLFYTENS